MNIIASPGMQTEQISLRISRMAGRVMEHQDMILAAH